MSSLYNFWSSIQPSSEVTGAIVGAFVGAVLTAMLTHWLAQRTEQQKYNRERYQKLYAPRVSEAYSYLLVNTVVPSDDMVQKEDQEQLREKVVNHIAENVMYGTPTLLSAYHGLRSINTVVGYKEDESPRMKTVKLFTVFLEDLYELKVLEGDAHVLLIENLTLYRIWLRLMEISGKHDMERGAPFLYQRSNYDRNKLNIATYNKIDKYINRKINLAIKDMNSNKKGSLINKILIRMRIRNVTRQDIRFSFDGFANVIVFIVAQLAHPNSAKWIADRIIEESRERSDREWLNSW
jgi:hypothetical protein